MLEFERLEISAINVMNVPEKCDETNDTECITLRRIVSRIWVFKPALYLKLTYAIIDIQHYYQFKFPANNHGELQPKADAHRENVCISCMWIDSIQQIMLIVEMYPEMSDEHPHYEIYQEFAYRMLLAIRTYGPAWEEYAL